MVEIERVRVQNLPPPTLEARDSPRTRARAQGAKVRARTRSSSKGPHVGHGDDRMNQGDETGENPPAKKRRQARTGGPKGRSVQQPETEFKKRT